MNHEHYMQVALDLARNGLGYTSPNPMVGAIVVKDCEIVGRGWHEAYGKAHAEVNALRDAGDRARGATLYVTLEPCNHRGKTPPCTEAVLAAGISHVVMAMKDPNPHVAGGGAERLKASGVQVTEGILEAEALRLNEAFVTYVTSGRPFVTLKVAATLDGQSATRTGDAKWISSESSRRIVHRMRHASDAIVVGIDTVLKDNPQLTTRLDPNDLPGPPKHPIRIVLDTHLRIDPAATVLHHEGTGRTWIIVGEDVDPSRIRRIASENVEIIPCPIAQNRIDLQQLLKLLADRKISSLLVEGGSQVIGSFVRGKAFDKFVAFFAPKLIQGNDGMPICAGAGVDRMADCLTLCDVHAEMIEQDVMITGYRHVHRHR
ncbi:MAG: bifunctional diaminohydroxyphosphoribosylaminopyrimidine deaminase/5-amino-6-(5-phosphoribosylamino)uracil reductase RibD [Thermodesulfobacteriota bacterium]